jgi:hypothetical protein
VLRQVLVNPFKEAYVGILKPVLMLFLVVTRPIFFFAFGKAAEYMRTVLTLQYVGFE